MRVAVTRPRAGATAACAELRARGFVPVVRSLVRVEPATNSLAAVLDGLARDVAEGADTWLIFTSAESVRALDAVRCALAQDWPAARVACVGPATAAAAERAGLRVTLIPSHYDGEALAGALVAATASRSANPADARAARFHWPRADGAGMALKRALGAAGGVVVDTVTYRTLPDGRGALRLQRDVQAGGVEAVLFFSPSAVDAFVAIIGAPPPDLVVGVIGRTTGTRARQYGIRVDVEPAVHTITALADALRAYADTR